MQPLFFIFGYTGRMIEIAEGSALLAHSGTSPFPSSKAPCFEDAIHETVCLVLKTPLFEDPFRETHCSVLKTTLF